MSTGTERGERPPQQRAIGAIGDAEAYRRAALRVYPEGSPHSDINLLIPAWHLLCHASELALKAYLLSGGADPGSKQGGLMHPMLRHDLIALHELAVERGFSPPGENFAALMASLAPHHDTHAFRYRREGHVSLPDPNFIAAVLEPVIVGIERTVRERWHAMWAAEQANGEQSGGVLIRAAPAGETG